MSEMRTSLVIGGRVDPSLGQAADSAGSTLDQAGGRAVKATVEVGRALASQGEAAGRAGQAVEGLGQALRREAGTAGQAGQAAMGVGKALAGQTAAAGAAAGAVGGLGQALREEVSAAASATAGAQSLGKALAKEAAGAAGAGVAAGGLSQALRRMEGESRRGERAARGVAQAGKAVDTTMGAAARATSRAGEALRKFTQAKEAAGAAAGDSGAGLGDLVSTAAVGTALRSGWRQSLNEDVAIGHLRTVINSPDPDAALEQAVQHARQYARDNMGTEVEMIDIQYALNSAGLTAVESRVGSAVVAQVATVTKGVTAEVGNVVATVYTNLGKNLEGDEQERLTRVGDILAKTQAKFKFDNFNQVGTSFATASAAASRFQVPLEQVAVALGVLNNAGIEGSSSGTAYTAVLRQLSKAQEELGVEIERGADGQMDFIATMRNVGDALAVYDDLDERNKVIQEVFGDEGAAGLTPLLNALNEMRAAEKDVRDGSRNFSRANSDRISASTSGQWQQLGENISGVGAAIMRSLHPAADAVLPVLNSTLATVGGMVDAFPALGAAVGVAGAAFVAFKGYALLRGVGSLVGGLRRLGTVGAALRGGGGGRLGGAGLAGAVGGIVPVQVVNWPAAGFGGVGAAGRGRGGRGGQGLGRLARGAGGLLSRAAVPLTVGLGAVQAVSAASEGDSEGVGGAIGSVGGTLAGAAMGAAIGSFIPVIGTAIGAGVGGLIGSFGGEALGRMVGQTFASDPADSTQPDAAYAKAQQERIAAGGAMAGTGGPGRTGPDAVNQVFTFHVTPPPGVDPRAIAEEVKRLFRSEGLRDLRGALHDGA